MEEQSDAVDELEQLEAASAEVLKPFSKPAQSSFAAAGTSSSGLAILVNPLQRGNPILKFLRNVPYAFDDSVVADYVLGQKCCALFLSLKFHRLNPDYIHQRLRSLARRVPIQLLLVQCDVDDPKHLLREINKIAIFSGCILILTWSAEETARYLEVYKTFEHKPPDLLMGKHDDLDDRSRLIELLCSLPSINRTDAHNLIEVFGSLRAITEASAEDLSFVPGFGQLKANRLFKSLRVPFSSV